MGITQLLYTITFHVLLLYLNQTTGVTATQLQRHDSYCCNTSGFKATQCTLSYYSRRIKKICSPHRF
ncbi:hypothetical protein PR001_g5986 [Phytophthora rubi]|uniref:Secreted protein n=2 Tax=Phytophthora rubi TaxID=129364 RepID=A0A6A3M334_9STRA|nr:hypothetical protein PR002_g11505 [Phytophthora rubi]KAE9042985.1 hypothetical protein PR001_g5986 [Phytophthora rubi]